MHLNDVQYKSAQFLKQQIQLTLVFPDIITFLVNINFSLLYTRLHLQCLQINVWHQHLRQTNSLDHYHWWWGGFFVFSLFFGVVG